MNDVKWLVQGGSQAMLRVCRVICACRVADALEVGQGFVESASNLVPESVPRPLAKGGVAVATGLVAFWILQKVRCTNHRCRASE